MIAVRFAGIAIAVILSNPIHSTAQVSEQSQARQGSGGPSVSGLPGQMGRVAQSVGKTLSEKEFTDYIRLNWKTFRELNGAEAVKLREKQSAEVSDYVGKARLKQGEFEDAGRFAARKEELRKAVDAAEDRIARAMEEAFDRNYFIVYGLTVGRHKYDIGNKEFTCLWMLFGDPAGDRRSGVDPVSDWTCGALETVGGALPGLLDRSGARTKGGFYFGAGRIGTQETAVHAARTEAGQKESYMLLLNRVKMQPEQADKFSQTIGDFRGAFVARNQGYSAPPTTERHANYVSGIPIHRVLIYHQLTGDILLDWGIDYTNHGRSKGLLRGFSIQTPWFGEGTKAPLSKTQTEGDSSRKAGTTSKGMRIWRDQTGRQLKAEYRGVAGSGVRVKRADDGKIVTIPLKTLSPADQEFVRRQARE